MKGDEETSHSHVSAREWLLYETPVPVDSGENSPWRGHGCGISCACILWQWPNPKVTLVEEWWSSGEHYDSVVIWQNISKVDVESRWIQGYDLCVLAAFSSSVLS